MKLIVNADDFGMSRGTNYGIYEAHKNGIVTSTTMMVTMPEVKHALDLAKDAPNLGIGLHLNITFGKPLTNCRTLLKEDGCFYKPKENPNQDLFSEEEIYLECKAQFDLFVKVAGKKPSHIDSHLYAHQVYKKARSAITRLAIEENVPLRDIRTDFENVVFQDWFKQNNGTDLKKLFQDKITCMTKHEICELMVHPAYVDDFLYEFSTYNIPRVEELETLTSKEIKDLIVKNNIELITYANVRKEYVKN